MLRGDVNEPVEITATEYDVAPMPDKYNTGVSGELTKIDPNGVVSGIQIKKGAVAAVFIFASINTEVSGCVVIENYDFSEYDFNTYEEDITDRDITVIFRNCRFGTIYKALEDSWIFFTSVKAENIIPMAFIFSERPLWMWWT